MVNRPNCDTSSGMGPIKLLDCSRKLRRRRSMPICVGIVPSRLFEERYKLRKLESKPIWVGITSVSSFLLISKVMRLFKFPILFRMGPLKRLLLRRSVCKFDRFPMLLSTEVNAFPSALSSLSSERPPICKLPFNSLLFIRSFSNDAKFDNVDGTEPVRKFNPQSSWIKEVIDSNVSGKLPDKRLNPRFIDSTLVHAPSSDGILPVRALPNTSNEISSVSKPSSTGIGPPIRWVVPPLSPRRSRLDKSANSAGIDPATSLKPSSKFRNTPFSSQTGILVERVNHAHSSPSDSHPSELVQLSPLVL